jgi:hypothetical protein
MGVRSMMVSRLFRFVLFCFVLGSVVWGCADGGADRVPAGVGGDC